MAETNNTYKVKPKDIIGAISGFPIEVVQRMVDCQVEQGNKADVTIFQHRAEAPKYVGGFNWHETKEGSNWSNIIYYKVFDLFFKLNPKE